MIPIAVIPQLTENPLNSKNNHNHLAFGKYSRKKYIRYNLFKFEIHTVRTLCITSMDKILILGHWSKLERRIFAHGLRRKRYDVLKDISLPH